MPVDLAEALAGLTAPWWPRTVATVNRHVLRVVRAEGEFSWHSHPETDELFLVLSGILSIWSEAGEVRLGPGQLHVVPRGVRHRPSSAEGADVLLFEPESTVNTGDSPGPLTAPPD